MKLAISLLCENPRQRTGLSTFFPEFVRAALAVAPDVSWVVFAGPEQPWDVEDPRVEVVRAFPSNERRLARLMADHFQVAPTARQRGADALLTVGYVPLRAAGLPVAMHVFAIPRGRASGRGLYRRAMIRRGLRRAFLVITNSTWASQQLGEVRSPMLVSPEGLQHDRFKPEGSRGLPGLPAEYVLWASNFYRYKRAELAVAAYADMPAELRARYPFVLAGGDWSGGRQRAEKAARALGVLDQTHFIGWVSDEDLPALYRGARAYVLSTAEETFGRSVAEALACGCPCVLQDLPVLREVAEGSALFTDFSKPAHAGLRLAQVCRDETLRARMALEGVKRAQAFRFDRLARERIEAIRRHLPNRS